MAKVINNDPRVHTQLKVVFIPNYGVSLAQIIIPAADLSEQISLAGTEASGTSNMKFALNGALTIGTLDGANVEMREHVGRRISLSSAIPPSRSRLRRNGYNPRQYYEQDPELHQALTQIATGVFSPEEPKRYGNLFDCWSTRRPLSAVGGLPQLCGHAGQGGRGLSQSGRMDAARGAEHRQHGLPSPPIAPFRNTRTKSGIQPVKL